MLKAEIATFKPVTWSNTTRPHQNLGYRSPTWHAITRIGKPSQHQPCPL